ncbi:MAG: substrate-binding domain-containing protein [Saccharofermentans sp.]|nr:substrate-binding domain-containing protein [Saccharofermentans sp.]
MKLRNQIIILVATVLIFAGFNLLCYQLFTRSFVYDRSSTLKAKSIEIGDYLPFDKSSKAITVDASLKLDGNLPVVDGAAALYPVFSSVVGSIYPEDSVIYSAEQNDFEPGSTLLMTNTMGAYEKIVTGEADIIFVAGPSKEQMAFAEENGVDLVMVPIGREAFVFFVNENNPVDNLTLDEIRGIYSGKIRNWSEVGGSNDLITPLTRNPGSGSQTAMEMVMNGEAIQRDYDAALGKRIAFSFRFYVEDITNYGGIKILSLNGVYPSAETIRDGSYPISSEFYAIYRADDTNPNIPVVIDWLLSNEGQALIEANGYVGVN